MAARQYLTAIIMAFLVIWSFNWQGTPQSYGAIIGAIIGVFLWRIISPKSGQ